MKRLLFSLAVVCYTLQAAGQYSVSGRVTDEEKQPLQHASVVITENGRGTTTDSEGRFSISAVEAGFYTVSISYVGYETVAIPVEVRGDLELEPLSLPGAAVVVEEVVVSSIRAGEETPVAFVDVSRDEIKTRNFGQDIPTLLSHVPSMVTTSDAGNGIGYSSMRIRGTDMNRINVTINGIPLNDAETHSVFWVDLPELAASAEQIQVQRGIGTSTNGAAAFGASVNIQTIASAAAPYVELESTAGSFNTFRNNISAGTGLINDRFSVDMRLSDVRSDGFIDRSWVELQSYFISAGYHDRKNSLKFLTFGGFEELYQSWGGVPSALLETNRTYNGMGMYTDISGEVQFYENQIDHFDQVHYQLHYSRKFGQQLRANLSGHYTRGSGYYEEFVPENDPFGEGYYSF